MPTSKQRGQLFAKMSKLQQAVSADPRALVERLRLAGLLTELGDAQQAQRVVDTGLESAPSSAPLRVAAAYLERGDGDLEAALVHLDEAAASFADAEFVATKVAFLLHPELGDARRALELLADWLSDNEPPPGLVMMLLRAQVAAGDDVGAVATSSQMLDDGIHDTLAVLVLARSALARGRWRAVVETLSALPESVQSDHLVAATLAAALQRGGDADAAKPWRTKALREGSPFSDRTHLDDYIAAFSQEITHD